MIGAGATLLTLLALSALVAAAALVTHAGAVTEMTRQVAPGAADGGVLTLLGLLYVPTLVGWALAYVSGAGFVLSAPVSPFDASGGVVPAFPLLAATPTSAPSAALLLLLLPVLAGAVGAVVAVRRAGRPRPGARPGEPRVLRLPGLRETAATAALTGVVAGLVAWLSSGSLGDGALDHTGPVAWRVALAVAVLTTVGYAVVVLLVRLGRMGRRRRGPGLQRWWQRVRPLLHSDGEPAPPPGPSPAAMPSETTSGTPRT